MTNLTTEAEKTLNWIEAYKNPIQLDIIINLLVYKTLSLTDLCQKLKKSKPTISKHTKLLALLGIIEETEKIKQIISDLSAQIDGLDSTSES